MTDFATFSHTRLVAGDWPVHSAGTREQVLELCRRHGWEPDRVRALSYELLDLPLLRAEIYDHDEQGRCYQDCRPGQRPHRPHEGVCQVATHTEERMLVGQLPGWWQPKETR